MTVVGLVAIQRIFRITLVAGVSVWFVSKAANAETYTLQVDGLACPFCSYGIEKQLRKLSGVNRVTTNIKTGTVRVRTKSGQKLTGTELRAAVKRSGFTLRALK